MIIKISIIYWLIASIIGYTSMRIDKKRAMNREYRISEKTLFIIACLGGSLGTLLGMYHFRHKTKHKSFVWGVPAILVLQVAFITYFLPILL